MKKLLFSFAYILMSLAMYATGQEGDVIYIDGIQWELLGKPIWTNAELNRNLSEALPKQKRLVTSNYSGYTAYWSIVEEQLCLDSICYEFYDAKSKKSRVEKLPAKTIQRLFNKYYDGERIVASWFTDNIRVAKGKWVYYQHDGYNRNYEDEQVICIDGGEVTDIQVFHNYMVDGFSFDRFKPQRNDVREMFPLHTEKYPALAEVKRIIFHVKQARVDASGHLAECEVRVLNPKVDAQVAEALAAEMAEALKAYYPWRVSFINGEYRALGIAGYSFAYVLP